MQKSPDRFF